MSSSHARTRVVAFVLGLCGLVKIVGCGIDRPGQVGDQTGSSGAVGGEACAPDGATRPCHKLISQDDGITNCSYGTQTCAHGVWTACGGGEQSVASFKSGKKTQAVTPQSLPGIRPIPAPQVIRVQAASSPAPIGNGATGTR